MTKRDAVALAKRVEFWQKKLSFLGLAHWRIEAVHIVDETPGGVEARATVQTKARYDNCRFWFTHDFVDTATQKEIDETILHEWMHVFMRDLDRAIESVEDALSPGVSTQWEDWVDHEREGVVDRLARQFYALADEN